MGWGVSWVGQTQLLETVRVSAEKACTGSLFHSLMTEGESGVKVHVSCGLRNEKLLRWLALGAAVSSCQCPFSTVEVDKATPYFIHKGSLDNSPPVM